MNIYCLFLFVLVALATADSLVDDVHTKYDIGTQPDIAIRCIGRLCMGNQPSAVDSGALLAELGITHIVSVTGEPECKASWCMTYQWICLEGAVTIDTTFDSSVNFLYPVFDQDDGSRVLVHCTVDEILCLSLLTIYEEEESM